VHSGEKATRRTSKGTGQHFFDSAEQGLRVGEEDRLFAHVYLDPLDPPKAIMLQFFDGSWEHRAFWGEDVFPFGEPNSPTRRSLGKLPKAGAWTRLEAPAAEVGLKPGAVVTGFAFTQHDGTVLWDKAGIVSRTPQVGQPFDSQAEWEASARAQSSPSIPELVHEAILVDPTQRSPEQSRRIRDYFLEHAYAKTRSILDPLHKEIEKLTRLREDLDATIPGGASFLSFSGRWAVRYEIGAVREYVVHANGEVEFPAESRKGRFLKKGDDWLVDFSDGKIERVRFLTSHEIHIEHYNPASTFGTGRPDTIAIGRRRIKMSETP
jgi:hypothetical protein